MRDAGVNLIQPRQSYKAAGKYVKAATSERLNLISQKHLNRKTTSSTITHHTLKMRLLSLFLAICSQALLINSESILSDSITIYIQPLSPSTTPSVLAEINYNPSTLSASISSFSPPELPDSTSYLKVGIYDPSTSSWKSSTSLTSAESFSKGYRPTLVVNLDGEGGVLGISVSSGKIDAGQTRDFGPKVLVKKMGKTKGPELNKPVVLSPEGKVAELEPEKTMLQK
jgi:hypothetical protein